jgi:hypothetical protein
MALATCTTIETIPTPHFPGYAIPTKPILDLYLFIDDTQILPQTGQQLGPFRFQ